MNLPQSPEGAACLTAAEACLTGGGMTVATIDMAGAMALALAAGVDRPIAAALVTAAADGIRSGLADRQDTPE